MRSRTPKTQGTVIPRTNAPPALILFQKSVQSQHSGPSSRHGSSPQDRKHTRHQPCPDSLTLASPLTPRARQIFNFKAYTQQFVHASSAPCHHDLATKASGARVTNAVEFACTGWGLLREDAPPVREQPCLVPKIRLRATPPQFP